MKKHVTLSGVEGAFRSKTLALERNCEGSFASCYEKQKLPGHVRSQAGTWERAVSHLR